MKFLKVIAFQSLFTLGILEFSAYFLLKTGLVADVYAGMGLTKPSHVLNQGMKWRSEEKKWGSWHKENFKDRHHKSCFDITYKSNNIGARDDYDYPAHDANSEGIIVLGDSFIEGFGLENHMTFPKILESMVEVPTYNLGSAIHQGPLQYLMIYKEFNYIPHNTIVVGFLPANDFTDNDLNYSKKIGIERYRPYYDINESKIDYPVHYTKTATKKSELRKTSLKTFITSQLFRFNLIKLYKNAEQIIRNPRTVIKGSHYISASNMQQKAATAHIFKIYEEAKKIGVKKFVVLGIPAPLDFKYFFEKGMSRIVTTWEKEFIEFANSHNDFIYIDGFNSLDKNSTTEDYKQLFLPCDGHWSERGAKVNAALVMEALSLPSK